MKIGIFDSGIGGLSVLHRARKMMPDTDFIYYADEAHVPYGEKTKEQLREYIKEILQFMLDAKVDAIVIACNTATTIVSQEERERFPIPIVGMEPAVKKAVDLYGAENKRILVAATPVTITGEKLHSLIDKVDCQQEVDLIALPKLVRFAEKMDFQSNEIDDYLRKEIPLDTCKKTGTIVLGCTHFNYFKKNFRSYFGDSIHFVDGNEGTIRQVMRIMKISPKLSKEGEVKYFNSGKPATEKELERIQHYMDQLNDVFAL